MGHHFRCSMCSPNTNFVNDRQWRIQTFENWWRHSYVTTVPILYPEHGIFMDIVHSGCQRFRPFSDLTPRGFGQEVSALFKFDPHICKISVLANISFFFVILMILAFNLNHIWSKSRSLYTAIIKGVRVHRIKLLTTKCRSCYFK